MVLQEDRNNSVTIGVADEHIGLVLGRNGRSVMEISQVSKEVAFFSLLCICSKVSFGLKTSYARIAIHGLVVQRSFFIGHFVLYTEKRIYRIKRYTGLAIQDSKYKPNSQYRIQNFIPRLFHHITQTK